MSSQKVIEEYGDSAKGRCNYTADIQVSGNNGFIVGEVATDEVAKKMIDFVLASAAAAMSGERKV